MNSNHDPVNLIDHLYKNRVYSTRQLRLLGLAILRAGKEFSKETFKYTEQRIEGTMEQGFSYKGSLLAGALLHVITNRFPDTQILTEFRRYLFSNRKRKKKNAEIIQHIFGAYFADNKELIWQGKHLRNFKEYHLPSHIRDMAQRIYDGERCEIPLSDALKDEGFEKLGKHFVERCPYCKELEPISQNEPQDAGLRKEYDPDLIHYLTKFKENSFKECKCQGTRIKIIKHMKGCWAIDLLRGVE